MTLPTTPGIRDPYDPGSYPEPPTDEEPAQRHLSEEEGYLRQARLLAEHVQGGGAPVAAPYPELQGLPPRYLKDLVSGMRRARAEAEELVADGTYDPTAVLGYLADIDQQQAANRDRLRSLDRGYQPPADPSAARLHTTVTRLFTDEIVHDVCGVPFRPSRLTSRPVRLEGRVNILGAREHDLGRELQGEYQVDVVDADAHGPASGALAVRLLWDDRAQIAGAVEAGRVIGGGGWLGIGEAGASQQYWQDCYRMKVSEPEAGLHVFQDGAFGNSVWFWSAEGQGGYRVFLVVDEQRRPVGVILDTSGIANFYWDDGDELNFGPWPSGQREFDPTRDRPGCPPDFVLPESLDQQ